MINLVNFVRFFKHLQLPAKTQRIRYNHLFVSLGIIKFFVLMKKMGETQVPFSYPLDLNRSGNRAGNRVYISFLDIFIKMPLDKISHDLIVCNKRATSPNKFRKLWGLNAEYANYIEDIQFKCCLSNFSPQYRSRIKSTPKIFKTWSCPLNGAMQYTEMWRRIINIHDNLWHTVLPYRGMTVFVHISAPFKRQNDLLSSTICQLAI